MGRYDWELINIVPHQGKLIAFFKRPRKSASDPEKGEMRQGLIPHAVSKGQVA